MSSPSPLNGQARIASRPGEHRVPHPRRGQRPRARPAGATAPDLAAVAREAVTSYLRRASAAAAVPAQGGPAARPAEAGPGVPGAVVPAVSPAQAQAVALQAAAMSVATLERMESAAAKLEADIGAALAKQAELQAGAGAAAEAAVRSAQRAWTAAGTAEEASRQARLSMRRIGIYLAATAALVLIQGIILVLFAVSAR